VTCRGCKRDGFLELSWCRDAQWCENRKCVIAKGIMGDYDEFEDIEELIKHIQTGKR
jgi:hypothetical protein